MKKNCIQLWMIMRGASYLLSLNLLVFLRRGFGERMAGDLCIACGFAWFCFWLFDTARGWACCGIVPTRLVPFFLYALTAVTACHGAGIWLRRKKPATIHSFGTGVPLGAWRVVRASDLTLQRYVQPPCCFLFALGLSRWDRALAYWIGAASLAVFVEEQLARFGMRRRVLDTIDGRIESQTLYGRVQQRISPPPAPGTQMPVIEVSQPSRRKTGKLKNIVARLDPELRKMLEPATEQPSGEKTP
jgi:drug/metabolite transporter superfamily protein YnfA